MATRRRRRTGPGSRSRRGFVANTKAPKGSYAIPASSPVGGKGRAKYPINNIGRARNAIVRVRQHGSAAEKRMVFAAVARKYPALAKRSSVPALARKGRAKARRGRSRASGRSRVSTSRVSRRRGGRRRVVRRARRR